MTHQPWEYTNAMKRLDAEFDHNVKCSHDNIDNTIMRIKCFHDDHIKMANALSKATIEYISCGYADMHSRRSHIDVHMHGTGWGCYGFSWQRYFNDLAKDMKRPFVLVGARSEYGPVAGKWDHRSWNFIRIPKRKYTEPLLEMFTIMPESVCRIDTNTVSHEVKFQTDDWKELTELWKERCLTQPSYRAALRLDV